MSRPPPPKPPHQQHLVCHDIMTSSIQAAKVHWSLHLWSLGHSESEKKQTGSNESPGVLMAQLSSVLPHAEHQKKRTSISLRHIFVVVVVVLNCPICLDSWHGKIFFFFFYLGKAQHSKKLHYSTKSTFLSENMALLQMRKSRAGVVIIAESHWEVKKSAIIYQCK